MSSRTSVMRLSLSLSILVILASNAGADVPRLINYQGKLLTDAGAAATGPVALTVTLYGHASDSSPVLFGPETHLAVSLTRGLFSIRVGSVAGGVPDSALNAPVVYLGVSIDGGDELMPRTEIVTAPYAIRTKSADQLINPATYDPVVTVDGGGDVDVGGNLTIGTAPEHAVTLVGSGGRSTFPGGVTANDIIVTGITGNENLALGGEPGIVYVYPGAGLVGLTMDSTVNKASIGSSFAVGDAALAIYPDATSGTFDFLVRNRADDTNWLALEDDGTLLLTEDISTQTGGRLIWYSDSTYTTQNASISSLNLDTFDIYDSSASNIASLDVSSVSGTQIFAFPDRSGTFVLADTSGNVGIGTPTPQGKLDVDGTLAVAGDTGDSGQVLTSQGPSAAPVWANASSGSPPGAISMYAGSSAPDGWLLCDGAAISRTTYASLFAVIGTTYGTGDGSTTFNLPNFKGRVPVGVNAVDSEFDTLGETGGEKSHVLTVAEMPAHSHSSGIGGFCKGGAYCGSNQFDQQFASTSGNTGSAGSGSAHNNIQPYLALYFIIKS